MAQTGQRIDPFTAFKFLVELRGIAQAGFTECSGLSITIEVIETREGGDNGTVRKVPGRAVYDNITLKWGLTSSTELWDWFQQTIDGNPQRMNGSIVALARDGTEGARWNFVRAWPTKWEGPTFNAKGNDIAIDTLVLAHEGLTRA